jgi:hypothetical protein
MYVYMHTQWGIHSPTHQRDLFAVETHICVSLAVGAERAVVVARVAVDKVGHGHLEWRVEMVAGEPHASGEVGVGRVGWSRDGGFARVVGSLVAHC